MKPDPQPADHAAVRSALDRFEGQLVRYALRITGNVESARDVVQDVFLRLLQADVGGLNGRLAPWLFSVCRNRALDVCRKEQRMKLVDESVIESAGATSGSASGVGSGGLPSAASPSGSLSAWSARSVQIAGGSAPLDPAVVVQQREGQANALSMLASLPDNQQEVLRLRFQNSLTYKEIAEVTQKSVSNVGFLIHTGLKAIREKLSDPSRHSSQASEPRP